MSELDMKGEQCALQVGLWWAGVLTLWVLLSCEGRAYKVNIYWLGSRPCVERPLLCLFLEARLHGHEVVRKKSQKLKAGNEQGKRGYQGWCTVPRGTLGPGLCSASGENRDTGQVRTKKNISFHSE